MSMDLSSLVERRSIRLCGWLEWLMEWMGCVGVFWDDLGLGLGLENGGSINILPHKGGGQGEGEG